MRPKRVAVTNTAASANVIATSQTPGGAGNLTLTGTAISPPRRIRITAAANESARTFTLVGLDRYGNVITETIAGPNATTADSKLDYASITTIAIDAASAGALTVGTNTIASSPWIPLDYAADGDVAIAVTVSGTVNWTVEQTFDQVTTVSAPYIIFNSSDATLVGGTSNIQSDYRLRAYALRLTVNSGTGTATMTLIERGFPA